MAKNTSRRNFLRTAPVAAAVTLSLPSMTHELLAQAAPAAAGTAPGADVASAALPFQMFTAKALDDDAKALAAKPGNNNLVDQKPGIPCAMVMTTEVHHSATEFEWHEGRDHIIQIIDGSTLYEVGGVPKNGHSTGKPGEWLAPSSEGSKSILMGKGDMLVLPRGTPHKRSTEDSVTLILISPYGVMKA
jgi:mannose-6-phosphate isomerase-like protein (cupin superfamily)